MALMTPQAVSSVITPSFTQPTTSDTITYSAGQWLHVKIGATSTTVTVVIPGNQEYSGVATTDLIVSAVTNTERIFALPQLAAVDGVITVTYSQVTNVTAGLFRT